MSMTKIRFKTANYLTVDNLMRKTNFALKAQYF